MFVRAGIPLDVGLHGTSERSSGKLGALAERLAHRLEMGASVEEAIAAEGSSVPRAYQAILEAGARSGRLDDVLSAVSELAESTSSLRRQLQLSMIYPVAVVTLASALFGFFLFHIVPQIMRTYEVFDLQRSFWVDWLFWLHRTLAQQSVTVGVTVTIVLMIVTGVLADAFFRRRNGATERTPGAREIALARFARVMSLLVEHRVPLPEAFRLSGEAAGSSTLSYAAAQLADDIERGQSLQSAVEAVPQLPPLLRWLVAVGQRQSSLAASLRHAADVYELRAVAKMEWFRRIVPPVAVIVCCGAITLLYALMLFLPVTEMLKQLGVG